MKISKQDRFAIVVSVLISLVTMGTGLFVVIPYWCYRFMKNDISFLNIQEDYSTVNQPLVPISKQTKNTLVVAFKWIVKAIITFLILMLVFAVIQDKI